MDSAPVDLSFKCISRLTDALTEEPSSGLRPLKKNSEGKYLSHSLRLSNNDINDLTDLPRTLSHFLAEPSQVAWLDLSFNKILHIEQVLCELHELRMLYLHGNCIFVLSEVDRLGALPHLHTVTLHGNEIEANRGYRLNYGTFNRVNRLSSSDIQLLVVDQTKPTEHESQTEQGLKPSEVQSEGLKRRLESMQAHTVCNRNRVISALPRLKMMDFSGVTREERHLAKIWHQSNSRSRNKETSQ